MLPKYEGEERREGDRVGSNIERHIGFVLQGIVLALLIWMANTVLSLNQTAIRLEERSTAATATSTRVEADVSAVRSQLQAMGSAIQAGAFRLEDLDRRVKGLELLKDRIR